MGIPASSFRRAPVGSGKGNFTSGDIYGPNEGNSTTAASNPSLGARAQAMAENGGGIAPLGYSNPAKGGGSPVAVFVSILVLLVVLRFFAGKTGDSDDYPIAFAPTFYNVMVVTLSAVLGLNLLKFVVVSWLPVNNPVRNMVLAA